MQKHMQRGLTWHDVEIASNGHKYSWFVPPFEGEVEFLDLPFQVTKYNKIVLAILKPVRLELRVELDEDVKGFLMAWNCWLLVGSHQCSNKESNDQPK